MAESNSAIKDPNVGTHNGHWTANASKSGTYEFKTAGKYVDRDIDLVVPASITYQTDGEITVTGGSVTVTGMLTSETDTGFSVTATGGSASVTAASIGATTGFIDNAVTASTPADSKTGSSETKYIKAQTTGTSNTGTNVATITPGASTQYINVTTGYQNAAKKWTINPISSATAATYEGGTTTVDSTSKVATRGDFHVKTAGYSGAANAQKLAPATFANTASSGTTYVDVSDAKESAGGADTIPVIPSNGYLYINKGYVDNLKVSLAKLVPDEANITESDGGDYILSGKKAYDADGKLIVGTIPNSTSKVGTKTVNSGSTIQAGEILIISAGYSSIDREFKAQEANTIEPARITSSCATYGFTPSQAETSFFVVPTAQVWNDGYATAGLTGGDPIYIPVSSIMSGLTKTAASTGYTAPGNLSTSPLSGAYLKISGETRSSDFDGIVAGQTTTTVNSYMPIYEGTYSIT